MVTFYTLLATSFYALRDIRYVFGNILYALCDIRYAFGNILYAFCDIRYAFGNILDVLSNIWYALATSDTCFVTSDMHLARLNMHLGYILYVLRNIRFVHSINQ